jgi:hypothetical protein
VGKTPASTVFCFACFIRNGTQGLSRLNKTIGTYSLLFNQKQNLDIGIEVLSGDTVTPTTKPTKK